ncbi:type I-C CRISPR-associated protein Cas7/Csd2 [Pelagicoccus sp. SDUM812003]|uniref:type I-C CRISPR-associated protein Cas7/Csd2 n=1 Tax=Pelagicoccus sp. SDUM812003 TaxID=3041267 RepID=UPI00280C766F|nr:type I-C CRISPR-associated protein Cas7/Csd2 [Pelagicoccus sp. SDUM812003]MDQ8201753.1 type I-C CRISPR-associated protein Cas7/Csd2 [Pelagicoccus sp. SDUM812003]
MSQTITNRFDFIYLFDVQDGNPNGDPDAGNLPRVDPETYRGLVTDGAIKRKIRDYVTIAKAKNESSSEPGYEIYFQTKGGPEKRVLNTIHEKAYSEIGAKSSDKKYEDQVKARKWMCDNFWDVRTFGAVMSMKENNCGQVRGPVQLTFARSLDRIFQQEVTITRKSVTTQKDAEEQIKKDGNITGTIGRKSIVPYGLYMAHGFVSAHEAQSTGFGEDDLELLWQALLGMFDHDRSASRGMMTPRKLIVFKHQSKLGNAPAHKLFDLLKIELSDACQANGGIPRSYNDYKVEFSTDEVPQNVEVLKELLEAL